MLEGEQGEIHLEKQIGDRFLKEPLCPVTSRYNHISVQKRRLTQHRKLLPFEPQACSLNFCNSLSVKVRLQELEKLSCSNAGGQRDRDFTLPPLPHLHSLEYHSAPTDGASSLVTDLGSTPRRGFSELTWRRTVREKQANSEELHKPYQYKCEQACHIP